MTTDDATHPPAAPEVDSDKPGKGKKTKAPRVKSASGSKEPPRKRGPPRPHRKLDQELLEGRIAKLEKRIARAKDQLEDASRHVEGYKKEAVYREQDKKNEQE